MYMSIKFPDFYLVNGANYLRFSELSRFSKCENDVIFWLGEINFGSKPQLFIGGQKLTLYAKKTDFETVQFLQSTQNIQTNNKGSCFNSIDKIVDVG